MPARRKDLNEATRADLEQIPQMSSARAETIVHYRDQHGPFNSTEELAQVPGIGETMAEQVGEYFSIRGARSSPRAASEDDEGMEDTADEVGGGEEEGQGAGGGGEQSSSSRRGRSARS